MRQARRLPAIARPRRGPAEKASEQAARLARTTGTLQAVYQELGSPPDQAPAPLQHAASRSARPAPAGWTRSPRRPAGGRSAPAAPPPASRSAPPRARRGEGRAGSCQNGTPRDRPIASHGSPGRQGEVSPMMSITAGAIRLTTARASCPGRRPASRDPADPDGQAAGGQVYRLPQPGARCPGRAAASSTPSISSRWTSLWLGG